MGQKLTDLNNPVFSTILTTDNVVLVHEGVVADVFPFDEEFEEEDDMGIYFEEE